MTYPLYIPLDECQFFSGDTCLLDGASKPDLVKYLPDNSFWVCKKPLPSEAELFGTEKALANELLGGMLNRYIAGATAPTVSAVYSTEHEGLLYLLSSILCHPSGERCRDLYEILDLVINSEEEVAKEYDHFKGLCESLVIRYMFGDRLDDIKFENFIYDGTRVQNIDTNFFRTDPRILIGDHITTFTRYGMVWLVDVATDELCYTLRETEGPIDEEAWSYRKERQTQLLEEYLHEDALIHAEIDMTLQKIGSMSDRWIEKTITDIAKLPDKAGTILSDEEQDEYRSYLQNRRTHAQDILYELHHTPPKAAD